MVNDLEVVQDATQDFVIANHFIEHCQNPIGALQNMLRVLKPGGKLYLSIPDKRYTFDMDRPITSVDHVTKDYVEGPEWSKRKHFEEWVTSVNKAKDFAEAEKQVADLVAETTASTITSGRKLRCSSFFFVWV